MGKMLLYPKWEDRQNQVPLRRFHQNNRYLAQQMVQKQHAKRSTVHAFPLRGIVLKGMVTLVHQHGVLSLVVARVMDMKLDVVVDQEEYDPMLARRLSRAFRLAGRFPDGALAMERSVGISPYDPSLREEAAAAAIEADEIDMARRHLEALVVLEPDQPLHVRRLEALGAMQRE